MQQLIEDGGDYDVTNVANLLNVGNGFGWQLDAVLVYDSDFKGVKKVCDNFDANQEYDANMPIYVFGAASKLLSSDIDQTNGAISTQEGSWSFSPRTLELSILMPEYADNSVVELECKLCSASSNAMVLEWFSQGEAIRAVLGVVAIRDMELLSINIVVANMIEECRDFDADAMVNSLQGEWMTDSSLIYNEEWTKIIDPLRVAGTDYADGLGRVTYVFNNGNVEVHSISSAEPNPTTEITPYTWSYDEVTGKLIFVGNDSGLEYVVSGFSSHYLILDCVTNGGKNLRTILMRQ